MRHSVDRRVFLRHAAMAGTASMAVPLEAFFARLIEARGRVPETTGYGPLAPVKDETTGLPLLQLPEGFRYLSFGWIGDAMEDGVRTPGLHDGMAAFGAGGGRVRLVRNHELTKGPAFAAAIRYDPGAGGGTTTLDFDATAGRWLGSRASLAGTIRNCAGGPTPWGSWLTCEETLVDETSGQGLSKPHGYIFEVPVEGRPTGEPLRAMGRFVHEATAVDLETGLVYETEDARRAGLYRFTPTARGDLAGGGRLEMLAIIGRPRFDTRSEQRSGAEYPVTWVPIDSPDRAHEAASATSGSGVRAQGEARGGAIFARLEGAWAGAGRIFFTATSGGRAEMGQVWELNPADNVLRLVFESPGPDVLNMPDNGCVSPRGGLVLCEDGTANPSIHGLTRDGQIFRFARNDVVLAGERNGIKGDFRGSEMAGATFSPDGRWLFFNLQSPGLTVAVTGPWGRGMI